MHIYLSKYEETNDESEHHVDNDQKEYQILLHLCTCHSFIINLFFKFIHYVSVIFMLHLVQS